MRLRRFNPTVPEGFRETGKLLVRPTKEGPGFSLSYKHPSKGSNIAWAFDAQTPKAAFDTKGSSTVSDVVPEHQLGPFLQNTFRRGRGSARVYTRI